MLKPKILVSVLALAVSCTAALAEKMDTNVIATVNGRDIIAQELIITAQQNKFDYNKLNTAQKKLLLNGLINRILVANEAEKMGMQNEDMFKLKMQALKDSVLAANLLEQKTRAIQISEDEIKAYYNKHIKTNVGKEYKARHILVKDEKQAQEISKELQADPKKFMQVAIKKSIDKGSAVKGGDLGWFNPATMVKPFADAVKAATKGKVTEPVKSQFGYHIILVEDSRDIKPPSLEQTKNKIKQQLIREKISAYLDELVKKAKIEIKL